MRVSFATLTKTTPGRWTGRLLLASGVTGLSALGGALQAAPEEGSRAAEGGMAPYLHDGTEDIIRHDYESAVREGTRRALELFIRHNESHPLAEEARSRLSLCFPAAGRTSPCPAPTSED